MKPIFKNYDAVEVANEIQNKLSEELKIYNDEIHFDIEERDEKVNLYVWNTSVDFVTFPQVDDIIEVVGAFRVAYGHDNIGINIQTKNVLAYVSLYSFVPCWQIRIKKNN